MLEPRASPALPGARFTSLDIRSAPIAQSASINEMLTTPPAYDHGIVDYLDIMVTPSTSQAVTWTLLPADPEGLDGAILCQSQPDFTPQMTDHGHSVRYVGSAPAGTTVTLHLCWPDHGPVRSDGPYLAAEFPSITMLGATHLDVSRSFLAPGDDYTLQGGLPPSAVESSGWLWSSADDSPLAPSLQVLATSLNGVARDDRNNFLAGVLFGIAGGALVALISDLFLPLRLRRWRALLGVPSPATIPPEPGPPSAPTPN
jgi:hypothetical protein